MGCAQGAPESCSEELFCVLLHGIGSRLKVRSSGPPRNSTAKGGWMLEKNFFLLRSALQISNTFCSWAGRGTADFPLPDSLPPNPEHIWTIRTISPVCNAACVVQPENTIRWETFSYSSHSPYESVLIDTFLHHWNPLQMRPQKDEAITVWVLYNLKSNNGIYM